MNQNNTTNFICQFKQYYFIVFKNSIFIFRNIFSTIFELSFIIIARLKHQIWILLLKGVNLAEWYWSTYHIFYQQLISHDKLTANGTTIAINDELLVFSIDFTCCKMQLVEIQEISLLRRVPNYWGKTTFSPVLLLVSSGTICRLDNLDYSRICHLKDYKSDVGN